jgi:hypothetical protein
MSYTDITSTTLTPNTNYYLASASELTKNMTLKPGKEEGSPVKFLRIKDNAAYFRNSGMTPMSDSQTINEAIFELTDEYGTQQKGFSMLPGRWYVRAVSVGGRRRNQKNHTRKNKKNKNRKQKQSRKH